MPGRVKAWRIGLSVVLLVYLVVFGGLLVSTGSMPYVMDGNESFSTLWHARNLAEHGLSQSYGLTDESFSHHAAGHPLVHTHQGNWPRVFGLFIYLLGARTIELQIAVTTLTIGLLAIAFAYVFFARITSPLFAALFCIVLMTDYVPFTQWHLVTYRVWHCFFVFSSLLCVHALGGRRKRLPAVLTVANFACLFYYELIFAATVAIFAALYGAFLYRRNRRLMVSCWGLQAVGAAVSLTVLTGQLIAYLGWEGFLRDVRYTLMARNEAGAANDSLVREMAAFFEEHHIAFWYNLVDSANLRLVEKFVTSLTSYDLQYHTPFFTLLTLLLLVPWLIEALAAGRAGLMKSRTVPALPGFLAVLVLPLPLCLALILWRAEALDRPIVMTAAFGVLVWIAWKARAGREAVHEPFEAARPREDSRRTRWFATLLFEAAAFALLLAVSGLDLSYSHAQSPAGELWKRLAVAITGAALSVRLVNWMSAGRWSRGLDIPSSRLFGAAVALAAATLVVRYHGILFFSEQQPLWAEQLKGWLSPALNRGALVGASLLVCLFIVKGCANPAELDLADDLHPLAAYLGCGALAYAVVYYLSPGYMYSGYIWRGLSPTLYWTAITVVAPVGLLLRYTRAATRDLRSRGLLSSAAAHSVLSVALLLFVSGLWIYVQARWVGLMRPNHLSFLKRLQEKPYRGATFVANVYGAPAAALAGTWAYYDPGIPNAEVRLSQSGYEMVRDHRYLWFADKRTNPAYIKPDYYLCMTHQGPSALLAMLQERRLGRRTYQGCLDQEIIRQDLQDIPRPLRHRLVDWDKDGERASRLAAWAIVKLDWDYPPFLRPAPGASSHHPVAISVQEKRSAGSGAAAYRVSYDYRYAHQDGIPERPPLVELLKFPAWADCDDREPEHVVPAPSDRSVMELPGGFKGKIAIRLTPRSLRKDGLAYYSEMMEIVPGSPFRPCGASGRLHSPRNLTAARPEPGVIRVHWYEVTGADHYRIEMARGGGPFRIVANRPNATPTYQVQDIAANDYYRFRVRACAVDQTCSPGEEVTSDVSPPFVGMTPLGLRAVR